MFYFLLGVFIVLIIILALLMESLLRTAFGVPYISTPQEVINQIDKYIMFKEGDVAYDLGAGDARFLITLKKKYPFLICRGYENAWRPYITSKIRIRQSNTNIEMLRKNFFHADIRDANVVFCYLWPWVNARLDEKFKKELKPGTKIITYDFTFPRAPLKVITLTNGHALYVYEV